MASQGVNLTTSPRRVGQLADVGSRWSAQTSRSSLAIHVSESGPGKKPVREPTSEYCRVAAHCDTLAHNISPSISKGLPNVTADFCNSTSMRRHGAFAFALLAALVAGGWAAGPAEAQELEGVINVQKFSPAPGPRNFIVTRGLRSDGEHALGVGFLAHYANKPFLVNSINEFGDESEVLVVENLATADLMFTYTPISPLQVGLRFPVTYIKGQGLTTDGAAAELEGEGVDATGLSDPELEVKFRFLGQVESPFTMGVAGFVTAPAGEATAEGQFMGAETFTGGGRLIADFQAGPLFTATNIGYRFQPTARVGASEVGSEALFGLGVGVAASPVFGLLADVHGTSTLGGGEGTNTLELAAAARITPISTPIAITLGAGPGLIHSIGGPVLRAFLGVAYVSRATDTDEDGLIDVEDQCPADAEDVDGYEDSDGCPDVDNDGDAIPDDADKCPGDPEDIDGFDDTDGCPDNDNDKDGLPDVSDRCPDKAENVNGFEDEDGCPDVPDTDADGVIDSEDKCPKEPEDTDGFQDTDGCPDLDNDGDGIPDDSDECVDEAEDMNGTADEDGCPDDGVEPPSGSSPPASGGGGRLGSEDNPIEL